MRENAKFSATRAALASVVILGAAAMIPASGQQAAPAGGETGKPLTLGVVLYPGFEVLDVFGPVEMFVNIPANLLQVVMVAEKAGAVASGPGKTGGAFSGPKAVADFGFEDAPPLDIILVPGGFGTLTELDNPKMLAWLKERSAKAQLTTSVCSGSALLAKAGLLDGKKATSNKSFFTMMTAQGKLVEWIPSARWVEDGNMITSSGVSAGMDMALAVIARLFGEEAAEGIAKGTEYVWSKDPSNDPFAVEVK